MGDNDQAPAAQPEDDSCGSPEVHEHYGRPFYEPLPTNTPHFRLLTLLAYDDAGRPICSLSIFRLDEQTYTALSYAWGDSLATELILVNGFGVCILPNLYEFLVSNAAKQYIGTPLFVDALCINQADIAEKQTQVALMESIYKTAYQVVLWSPPLPNDLLRPSETNRARVQTLEEAILAIQHGSYESSRGAFDEYDMVLCAMVVSRAFAPHPVWRRLWIVQEVVLAERLIVQLGDHAVNLELYESAVLRIAPGLRNDLGQDNDYTRLGGLTQYTNGYFGHTLGAIPFQAQPLMALALRRKSHARGYFERQPLHALIAAFHDRESTELRDRIFGMLAMAETDLHPDYEMSLTDLYLHVLIEGFRTISTRSPCAHSKVASRDFFNFQTGMINIFGFSPSDLTVYAVSRMAFASLGLQTPRNSLAFRMLWAVQLELRPWPLLELWGPSRKAVAVVDRLHAWTRLGVTPQLDNFGPRRLQFWLPLMRRAALDGFLSVLLALNIKLCTPDRTSRTIPGWSRRLGEIGALVEQTASPQARERHRQGRIRCSLDGKRVGQFVDLVSVLVISMGLALLGRLLTVMPTTEAILWGSVLLCHFMAPEVFRRSLGMSGNRDWEVIA